MYEVTFIPIKTNLEKRDSEKTYKILINFTARLVELCGLCHLDNRFSKVKKYCVLIIFFLIKFSLRNIKIQRIITILGNKILIYTKDRLLKNTEKYL